MTFKQYQKQVHGYDCITTFWDDFAIADHFGLKAVKDTFKRAFKEWKSNYKYLTELVLVLNHRCWKHYEEGEMELSRVYSELYHKAHYWASGHLKGEEYKYYFKMTD